MSVLYPVRHFTVLSFVFACVIFVKWAWRDQGLIPMTISSFSALTLLVGSFDV